jgi:hypothetical protein
MNKKLLIFLGIFLGSGIVLRAQVIDDLARYSGLNYQGTARSTAIGNACGAVGADFGSININPAGLGLYRRPELTFTLGFDETTTSGSYLGNTASDNAFNFNVGNLGLVIANPRTRKGQEVQNGWVSVNWAIGFNRTNNYWSNTVIEGTNKSNSILNSYKEDATNQGVGPSLLTYGSLGYLGYYTYLVDPVSPTDSTHYADATRYDNKINVYQRDKISTTGASNNISMSFAGNYSNKFYIGGSIGVPVVDYSSTRTFEETNINDIDNTNNQYRSSVFTENLNTSGVGITANIGAIYRFDEMFRAGLSLQLPAIYSLTDTFGRSMTGITRDYHQSVTASDNGNGFTYTLITPARVTLSGAFFFNKNGFISADYEYTDYSTARVDSKNFDFFALNQAAKNSMTGVHNVRVGGEYRVDQFAFRAGYNFVSSPFKQGLTLQGYADQFNILSLGAGFRDQGVSFDLTYQYMLNNSTYTPYSLNDGSAASAGITTARSNLMLTFGTRF